MIIKHRLLATLLITSSLSLTACVSGNSNDAYTNYQQTESTANGAVIGAAAGAVTGAATAGVGTVIGAVVGHGMDKNEIAMRRELRAAGVSVKDPDDGKNDIWLVMPANIGFKSHSAELSPALKTRLNAVAKVMQYYKYAVAEVPGYTDSIGSRNYNMRLSSVRAQAVVDYLISQGINSDRLTAVGYGESRPVAANHTPNSRALNRRVEIILHQPPRI